MSGFYVSLIFIGILLVLFSLACIFLDKRKVFQFTRNFEDKKQELVEIIQDAEQMIEELNRFSDYIVNQMDLKNEELCKNLKDAEERVNALGGRAKNAADEYAAAFGEAAARGASAAGRIGAAAAEAPAVRTTAADAAGEAAVVREAAAAARDAAVYEEEARYHAVAAGRASVQAAEGFGARAEFSADMAEMAGIAGIAVNSGISERKASPKLQYRKNDKIIPIHNKYSEVIRLSQEGLQSLEIAKRLNMGKGEVELILGLRR
jgi:exonuclease VII small subunit